jgi:beta-N-acetylhexosaminidase
MNIKPILFGCKGPVLLDGEREFFKTAEPLGFILFKRNCETPEQIRKLTADLREAVGRDDAPVFIDQEGGPVARLRPPKWIDLPAMRTVGELYEKDRAAGEEAAKLHARITATMLRDIGVNGNFAPVLDLFIKGATSAIGQRAISADPAVVASVANIVLNTYLDHGVMPVIKHMPGHGRALVDPHQKLPVVETPYDLLSKEDLEPFRRLRHAPCGMNCHVVFKAFDPENPVSLSHKVHKEVLRGLIGFQGIIFSDDLAMKALEGALDQIVLSALTAGADVLLYCPGFMPEMSLIAASLPSMALPAKRRWDKAWTQVKMPRTENNPAKDKGRLDELLSKL